VTVSVGVAEYPSCGSDKVALYSAADQAVYAAKEQGRNRVRTAPFGQVVSLKSKA
jgi:PleD family two-component response regulator